MSDYVDCLLDICGSKTVDMIFLASVFPLVDQYIWKSCW